ncbi:uncharacterized protein [Diadema antillarum]|uniref:uncharacterized protein n=1 Tax=Diadema antillarum TaxID=105358 RepID=UPI003A8B53CD
MSSGVGMLEINGTGLAVKTGEVVGSVLPVDVPTREALANTGPSNRRGGLDSNGKVYANSAVEFYTQGTFEKPWQPGSKSDAIGSSVDSVMEVKLEDQRPKFISASYAGPDVVSFPEQRYSRRKNLRKMSLNNNRRIVSYLRKRFRERGAMWLEDDLGDSNNSGEQPFKIRPKTPGPVDIFSKYNEIGGRVSREGHILDGLYPGAFTFSPTPTSTRVSSGHEAATTEPNGSQVNPEGFEDGDGFRLSAAVTLGQRLAPVIVRTAGAGEEQELFQKLESMARIRDEGDGDVEKPELLEVQSLTGKSDSVSSKESRNSSGKSEGSRGSPFGTLSPMKAPRPPEGPKPERNASRSSNSVSTSAKGETDSRQDHLPQLPQAGPVVGSPKPTPPSPQKDLKLPSLTGDGRRHPTLSANVTQLGHQDHTSQESSEFGSDEEEVISPVSTPFPVNEDPRRSLEYQLTVDNVLQSRVDVQCSWESNIFRLYVCSTFTDFEAERTILMSKTFPRLRAFCRERGFEFQLTDMNWGIRDFSTDNHSYAGNCLRELRECEEVSQGPYFVTLMGQRSGFQALSDTFPVEDFEAIVATIEKERESCFSARRPSIFPTQSISDETRSGRSSGMTRSQVPRTKRSFLSGVNRMMLTMKVFGGLDRRRTASWRDSDKSPATDGLDDGEKGATEKEFDADINALKTWYRRDDNSEPPVYVLQPISSQFREILSNDKQRRLRAKNQWIIMYKRLVRCMAKYAEKSVSDKKRAEGYLQTVTERELDQAVFSASPSQRGRVACFVRQVKDMRKNLQDFSAKDYIDMHNLKPEVDVAKFDRVEDLRNVRVPQNIGSNNVREYSVRWHKDGISPQADRSHAHYLDGLANDFYEAMKTRLERAMVDHVAVTAATSYKLYEEVAQHVNFVQEKASTFYGRKECLQHIKDYLAGSSNQPLVVCGLPGYGKTALLAKACQLTGAWFKSGDVATVVRFVGLTADSENVRALLQSVCQQIGHTYSMDLATVPEDYHALINDLEGRISVATEDRPLVIYIDGPDKLSNDHKARSMTWLPSNLPPNVKVVLSCTTLPEEKTDSFKALKKQCPNADFYTVPELSQSEARYIAHYLIGRAGRRLTDDQHQALMKAMEENSNPLYLRLVCDEAVKWKSYTEKKGIHLASDLRKMINGILASLESKHGEPLVRRALGYLTAARSGLSWSELTDLLSCDEHAMNDIATRHSPSLRRLPPALWCRLKADMRKYFRVWKVDGVWVWRWADQQFKEAATDRYLNQKDRAPSYHSAMAEYFMGTWAERKKPYPGNEGGADRFVDPQPLMLSLFKPSGAPLKVYNMRKLNELPHHFLHANQLEALKSEVLVNYEWTLAKLRATSLRHVLDDVQSALTVHPNDLELRLLSDTLHLSSTALTKDPTQLASQLVGRLLGIVTNDKPMSIGDPKKYPTVAIMLGQAQRSSIPALVPSVTCLAQPGGVLYDLLAGHVEVITAVTASRVTVGIAATASRDGTVKLWDLKNRKVVRTIEGVGKEISSLRLCLSDTIAVTVESSCIQFLDFDRGTCLLSVRQYIDPPVVTAAGEQDELVVAFFSGSNVMRTWILSEGAVQLQQEVDIGGTAIHKDGSLCASFSANGDRVLYAFRSSSAASVVNARTGNKVHSLPAPKASASITALGVSKDYYVVACRYLFQKATEIHRLELFDIKNGAYLRAVQGCTSDVVNELLVNRQGSHAVSLCPNAHTNTTTLAVWNLETEDHKHLAKHAHLSRLGACMDLMYCLTASKNNKSLRMWNISKKVNERNESTSKVKGHGISGLVPMIDNARYVVAKTVNNGPLSVWNVVKGKCAGSAVRIERGLTDQHDIVLVRNNRVVILSELGMSSVSENPTQVFQTVFIYDLGTKKYVRKLTGVFIVPSPAHEYRLLDGELLLGLSETRDHFIAWNLVSGHIKFRIKKNFRTDRAQMKKEEEELRTKLMRQNTANMSPWERRSETHADRQKRKEKELEKEKKRLEDMRKEKENAIQQFLMSADERVLVCSYFAHHLCVFDVQTQQHVQTVENPNSMLYLYVAALSPEGKYLAHATYDDSDKVSYITVWNLHKGEVRKRLKKESNVCCIGINATASRVLFGNERHQLKVWDIQRGRSTLRRLHTSAQSLQFTTSSRIFMIDGGSRAVVVSGDITLWDLDHASQLAMFTPDLRISCVEVVMDGQLIVFGLRDSSDVVTLRLKGRDVKTPDFSSVSDSGGKELFGETTGDTSPEDEDEEPEQEEEGAEG